MFLFNGAIRHISCLPDYLTLKQRRYPAMSTAAAIALPAQEGTPDLTTGSILFIGTATVLIRYADFTILTDPNFIHRHEQVPLGYGLHATRLTDPARDIHDLPPLDL